MQILDIFIKPDFVFHGSEDDTLINRLSSSILCHENSSFVNCQSLDNVLTRFFTELSPSGENDNLKLLRLALVLLCKNYENMSESLVHSSQHAIVRICSTNSLRGIFEFIESIQYYLEGIGEVSQVRSIKLLLDETILQHLHGILLEQTNVHQKRLLLCIFAHLTVYEAHVHNCDLMHSKMLKSFLPQISTLTEMSQAYLLALYKVTLKFSSAVFPVRIDSPFPLFPDDLNKLDLNSLSQIIFMYSLNVVQFSNDASNVLSRFLTSHPQSAVVCAKTIALQLRMNANPSSHLWNTVSSLWLSALSDRLNPDAWTCLKPVIDPVLYAVGIATKPALPSSDALLQTIVSKLFDYTDELLLHTTTQPYRIGLMRLLAMLANNNSPVSLITECLKKLSSWIEKLSSVSSTCGIDSELMTVYHLTQRLCAVLMTHEKLEPILTFTQQIVGFVQSCYPHCFTIHIHGLLPIWATLKPTPSLQQQMFPFLRLLLVTLSPESGPDQTLDSSDFNSPPFWIRVPLLRQYFDVLIRGDTLHLLWTNELSREFVKILNTSLDNIQSAFDCVEVRGYLLCLMLSFLSANFRHMLSDFTELIDDPFPEWISNVCLHLTNFDLSELRGLDHIVSILRITWEQLSQISTDSISSVNNVSDPESDSSTLEPFLALSAPGKVILSGEHAVLHGHPAVAVAIDLCCHAVVRTDRGNSNKERLCISFTDLLTTDVQINCLERLSNCVHLSSGELVQEAHKLMRESSESSHHSFTVNQSLSVCFYLMLRCFQIHQSKPEHETLFHSSSSVLLEVHSDIPIGAGLGSSAAFCTVMATAFLVMCGCIPPNQDILQNGQQNELIQTLSHEAETIVHGKSSGLDTTTSVQGGAIRFQLHSDKKPSFRQLRFSSQLPPILVVNSLMNRSTGDVVRELAAYRLEHLDVLDGAYTEIGNISTKIANMLDSETALSLPQLSKLILDNQKLLRQIGASCSLLDDLIDQLEQDGLATKLTGAGRGGCLIAIASTPLGSSSLHQAASRMEDRGLWARVVSTSVQGVRIHHHVNNSPV